MKYFDDGTAVVAIDLKEKLKKDQTERPRPLTYNEKSQLHLPIEADLLQKQMDEFENFTNENNMKINQDKSKLIIFNMSHKYRFPPEQCFSDGNKLELLENVKVLGVTISSDLRWKTNTEVMTSKARSRIWTLRRLDNLGFDNKFIIDVYIKEIRSILEYNVPVWNGSLTRKDSEKIEMVQKSVLKLLMKHNYTSYTEACKKFNIEKLFNRRLKLCIKFSQKEFKKENNGIFTKNKSKSTRKINKKYVIEPRPRTSRYFNSPIPYLSRLLNEQASKE